MTSPRRIPPGRAGRLWLLDRLRSGRLAASLLDRKVRILRAEQERLREAAEQSRARWLDRAREADLWGQRAALLAGERELRHSTPDGAAEVVVEWGSIMGARYPAAASTRLPAQAGHGPGTAALVEAGLAYRQAVEAAAAHAAVMAAARIVEDELQATGRRLRAISQRWLPRLESWLASITRDLEETEREEAFRLRWAASGGSVGTTRSIVDGPAQGSPRG